MKIRFENGVVMNLDREPIPEEIEELGKIALTQGQKQQISQQPKQSFIQKMSTGSGPILKTVFQPLSKTLTGQSLGERTDFLNKKSEELLKQSDINVQKDLQQQLAQGARPIVVPKTPSMMDFYMNQREAATKQGLVNMVDLSPFDIATLKASTLIPKIPIGSTNIGRMASNVAIKNPLTRTGRQATMEGVKELQRLESALQKSGQLSSRGIPITTAPFDMASENKIFSLYNQAIGAKIKNVSDVGKVKSQRVTGLRAISENLNNIKITNPETGALESKIPNTRLEFLEAFKQSKPLIWKKVNQMSEGATEQKASINLPSLVDRALNKTKQDIGEVALKNNPTLLERLEKESLNIKSAGNINPTQSEEYMKFLNNQVNSLRKSGQALDFSVKDLYSNVLHSLNEQTDSVIESTLGQSGYGIFRDQYSALKSMEKELISSANKYLRQESGQAGGMVHPIIDLWSLENALRGGVDIISGNVPKGLANIGKGLVLKGASKLLDRFRNPDRKISQIFETIQQAKTIPRNIPNVRNQFLNQPSRPFPFPEGTQAGLSRRNIPIRNQLSLPSPSMRLMLPSPKNVPYNPSGRRNPPEVLRKFRLPSQRSEYGGAPPISPTLKRYMERGKQMEFEKELKRKLIMLEILKRGRKGYL